MPSAARKRVCLSRLILRTEISPVVTSPGPMPGVAWTAAITARRLHRDDVQGRPAGLAFLADREAELGGVVRDLLRGRALDGDRSFAALRAGRKQHGERQRRQARSEASSHLGSRYPAAATLTQAWARRLLRRPGVRTSWIGRRAELGTT